MFSIIDCYRKVNNECIKFIKSQETSKEKFKNKEKMIKSFLIPISFWIAKNADKKKPYIIGLSGGQGTGKTTGEEYSNRGHFDYKWEDGKIAILQAYYSEYAEQNEAAAYAASQN